MPLAQSKLTTQGQISVPLHVRKILGVGPGSVLEWEELNGEMVVRRAVQYSSADIHKVLFQEFSPEPLSLEQLKSSLGDYAEEKHKRLNAGN